MLEIFIKLYIVIIYSVCIKWVCVGWGVVCIYPPPLTTHPPPLALSLFLYIWRSHNIIVFLLPAIITCY